MKASTSNIQSRNVRTSALLWAAPVTAVIAAVINTIIYFIGKAAGAFPESIIIPNANAPLKLPPVILASLIGVLVGGIVFAVIARFSKKPISVFQIVAAVVLILSLATPFQIPNAPLGMVLLLELMHLIAGSLAIWLMPRLVKTS